MSGRVFVIGPPRITPPISPLPVVFTTRFGFLDGQNATNKRIFDEVSHSPHHVKTRGT